MLQGVTYRKGTYEEGDNDLWLEIEVQMADSVVNEDQSNHWLSAGARLGRSIIISDKPVKVQRDNTEQPDLLLSAEMNETIVYDSL